MSTDLRFKVLGGMLLLVMLVSAVLTTPALADGGAPPPSSPSTTSTTGGVKLPSGTRLVVLDGGGHKVPLGSQIAAQAIASSDPVWCPATVATPAPGAYGCTSPGPGNINYDPTRLDSLVNYLSAHQKTVNGTIWITGGPDGSLGTITLNGSAGFTTMSMYALTLKGGWTGTSAGHIDPATPSLFNQGIQILNWKNNVTLTDIQTNGTVVGRGVWITTTKNIVLTRVQANTNVGYGATLDNTSGNGSVKVTNSTFNWNATLIDLYGLEIQSRGAITLNGVTVAGNLAGAYLNNSNAATAQPVTIVGTNISGNSGDGLWMYSKGAVKLSNVSSSGNGGTGAFIDNTSGTAGVTLGGSNVFSANQGSNGLQVKTRGAILIATLTASANSWGTGADLDNSTAASARPVTLTGSGIFSSNNGYGLRVTSHGAIALRNITASANSAGDGAHLQNNYLGCTGGVTLTGSNIFASNSSYGLDVLSNGPIKVYNLISASNASNGADLNNSTATIAQPVTLAGSSVIASNANQGLVVYSRGAIVLNNIVSASNAGGDGAHLQNNYPGATGGVTLTGSNVFASNGIDGLDVDSNGAITAYNLTSNGNLGGNGASLYNAAALSAKPVTLIGFGTFETNGYNGLVIATKGLITAKDLTVIGNDTSLTASTPGARLDNSLGTAGVTLTGTNIFSANKDSGLSILSKGAVLLNSVLADGNSGFGARVYNSTSSLYPGVTLTGTNEFKYNSGVGLDILTRGAISVRNVTAVGSFGNGVSLNNTPGDTAHPKPVTVSGTNIFNNNTAVGLSVTTYGAITASNLTALGNGAVGGSNGVELLNYFAVTPAPVTLGGVNVFNNNFAAGLYVRSMGAIKVHSVTANGSQNGMGASLYNDYAGTAGGVVVSGTNVFNDNHDTGLWVMTRGAVSLSNLTANGSDTGYGVEVVGKGGGPTAPKPITLTGTNLFIGNAQDGLHLETYGAISVRNVTANQNSSMGMHLLNAGATIPANVTVSGVNMFNNNAGYGLNIQSEGTVSVAKTTADWNGSDGLHVNTAGKITVTCGSFLYSTGNGLNLTAGTSITLIGIMSQGNSGGDIITSPGYTSVRTCPLP